MDDVTPSRTGRRAPIVRLAVVLFVAGTVWHTAPATATDADDAQTASNGAIGPPDPAAHPDVLHGRAATTVLERVPRLIANAVAHRIDRSLDELVADLTSDPTMFITTTGMAGHVEPAVPASLISDTMSAPSDLTVPPGLDVFALSSRPSSPLTIHLDLDGHLLEDEPWNDVYGLPPTPLEAFDRDGDPATFSAAERAEIYEIWLSVADDFAPFDVNVTTADPGTEALRRSGTGDLAYGSRVVVTGTNWRGSAGIAFLNVFAWSEDVAAFAFSDQLRTGSRVAQGVSHEIGHTLGLRHDGYRTSDYYFGTSTWGPIMGGSGGSAIIQWSKGDYPDATRFEDDLAMIGDVLPPLADDHGATVATATVLSPSTVSTLDGLINHEHDVDVFDIDVTVRTDLVVRPAVGTSNLHTRIEITDPAGRPTASLVPTQAMDWVLEAELAPGRHVVSVRAAGWGVAPHGFTTYGALGAYVLTVEPDGPPPPTTTPTTAPPTTEPPTTEPPTTEPPTSPTTPSGVGPGVNGPVDGSMEPAVRVDVSGR